MPSPNPHDKVKNTWKRDWARNKTVYLVFVPVAIYIIVTHYLPMFGIVMAFQDFSLSKGVFGSTFVGPDNFVELFTGDAFLNAFKNTAIMAAFSLVLGFFPRTHFRADALGGAEQNLQAHHPDDLLSAQLRCRGGRDQPGQAVSGQ
jgi:putative transmembrane lipoprotein lplB